ncbi:MAG: T9SS type A sorting domain-containing protein, partial [Bacteroidales bacterium]|nr:T9SS type A sorting domain-containing protein [Bacteroidales bacterium]
QYTYSLDSFVNQSCVIVVFEAMRMSLPQFDGEQYIDRIKLTSNQDLSIEEMIVPELTPCDYTGKELSIVLGSLTAQNISFESYPTSLQVNITGATTQTYNIPLNSGIIPGMDYDTLVLDNDFDFNPGTYYIYAKIMTSIDKVATNDVLYDTIIVNPSIDVAATQVTGGNDNTNCIGIEGQVNQVVVFTNDGNMDMEDVILTLNVYDITGAKVQTIEDTLAGVFAVNQTTTYTFAEAYDVPEGAMYNVEVVASPMCNATLTYTDVITECVDQSDVEVTAFINPADDETCSSVGTNIKVKVRVSNNHPDEDVQGVVLNVVVSTNNTQIASWTETLSDIASDSYIDFEFPQGFNVPEEADYTIVAYVNSIDAKSSNDTLSMTKCTDLGLAEQEGDVMFLGQNIPNPANAQTVVNYQVHTEGTVVFTLTTVTGQVIYTTAQEVEAGRNSVEFNTENLAAGIYFYTMDFNGQRLTKKMTIRR